MSVKFWTPGEIPLTSFTIMGANVKSVDNPIGQFGTGLKYAVSVILRHGGVIRMFVGEVEYEFIVSKTMHRGREFETPCLRKRHGVLSRWISVTKLPFTLDYGRNWSLWQAYRELESNTRDEKGITLVDEDLPPVLQGRGTVIEVDCPGFVEAVESSETFFDSEGKKMLYSGPMLNIYSAPSNHLYYRGIRVYELRYPARLTYDFKHPYVHLTEDRTAGNAWSLLYSLSRIVQKEIDDPGLIRRMMNVSGRTGNEQTFETMELDFAPDEPASPAFHAVASSFSGTRAGGRSITNYWRLASVEKEGTTSVELQDSFWEDLIQLTQRVIDEEPLDYADRQRLEEIMVEVKNHF